MLDEVGLWFTARISGTHVVKGTVETAAHVSSAPRTRVASSSGLFEGYFCLALITDSHNPLPFYSFSLLPGALFIFSSQAVPLLTFFKPDLLIPLRAAN